MKYFILVLLLTTFNATADDEISFIFGGWSKHVNSPSGKYENEVHDIIAFRYKSILFSPYFINSHGDSSEFIAYVKTLGEYKYENFEYTSWYALGIAHGYYDSDYGNELMPMAQAGSTFLYNFDKDWGIGVNLVAMPNGWDRFIVLGSFNLTYRF